MRQKIADHVRTVESVVAKVPLLEEAARKLIACFDSGGCLYLMGNGGSAADAQHIAAEFIGRFKQNRRPLPAVALTTDSSSLTALSNDFGFEQVFERQVQALVTERDVVWALSVSGASPNVIRALEQARKLGATVIGFTGEGPNDLSRLSDLCLQVAHRDSGRVQEMHQLAYHLICDAVETHYAKKS